MYNIRDWCISRQLWWGHRIPAWHCGDCKEITVAREDSDDVRALRVGSTSSRIPTCSIPGSVPGLWPFSTLGWPDDTADLRAFYPTTLLVTGFDIIFFWAARMIMLGIEMMGDVPFRQVHIHGLVRDAERQKMSKTKGNVIDPLVINEKYGTDAVRFALLVSAAPGNDIALSEERIARGRNFANKIWNASRLLFSKTEEGARSRFVRGSMDRQPAERCGEVGESRVRASIAITRRPMRSGHFFWDEFCDWYLELKKSDTDWSYAFAVYEKALRLLHPLMPFITEELWHRRGYQNSIALERYPQFDAALSDPEIEERVRLHQEVITSTRARLG